jgi:hypothetical protein
MFWPSTPQLPQTLPERRQPDYRNRIVFGIARRNAEPSNPIRLLRARRERPSGRAAEECDEVAPSHAKLPVEDKAYQRAALCVTAK